MSYENAVPKPLKFLISDGKMIDDAGNVIAESETLKDLYTKWEPEVKKYLLSDGSVVDENNNLIIKNDYYKKIYDQADPKVAKYLHADGTIDENSGGSSVNIQDNKQVDITSNGEVEIEPDNDYDGMKKVTAKVNVPLIPTKFYLWSRGDGTYAPINYLFNFNKAPETVEEFDESYCIYSGGGSPLEITKFNRWGDTYRKISDTQFRLIYGGGMGYYDYTLIEAGNLYISTTYSNT